jgi:hypothetical protein
MVGIGGMETAVKVTLLIVFDGHKAGVFILIALYTPGFKPEIIYEPLPLVVIACVFTALPFRV